MSNLPFFTVGHSNRRAEEFGELLQKAAVEFVADIRKLPGSRAQPQFNADALQDCLSSMQIGYAHIAELGGRRGRTPGIQQDTNALWTNRSFHNYADHALTETFRGGLRHLITIGRRRRCAVMCAEAVWWRCHRRIVADYLLAQGETVFHVMGEGRVEPARLTAGAVIQPDGAIHYPAARTKSPGLAPELPTPDA